MGHNTLSLLEIIYDCQTKCKYCFNACLEEEDINRMRRCIKLDIACSEICELTASSLIYAGDFTAEILSVCIKACEECAEECSKHQYIHCLECAKACRMCAESCKGYMEEYRETA